MIGTEKVNSAFRKFLQKKTRIKENWEKVRGEGLDRKEDNYMVN